MRHALDQADNGRLMSDDLIHALVDHAQGNIRALMNLAGELLVIGLRRERATLDADLLLDLLGEREPKTGGMSYAAR